MAIDKPITSRLFTTSVIEGRIDLDEKYDKAYNNVISLTRGLTEKEAHDVLNKALDDRKVHDEICLGLLVVILSEPANAQRYYHDLTLVSRDSLKAVTEALIHQIIGERYSRLQEGVRKQLLWLVKELVKTGINNVEGVVWCLLRQIAGGDLTPKNLWLAENLVDVLIENRPWLDKFPVIVASVAYTYLRIIEDHFHPKHLALRQKEVTFVIGLLRERFTDCLMIGRDLVRLLQNVAKIPEIEAIWRDLLHNPTSLAPNFTGIQQLLQSRTSRRFFVQRLTPEMEKKMVFLCTDVKFGTQKRYQEWFQRNYLNTPESQTLRCDLIRFIIGCIHPSNEVLCSDIIPRWAVIGWLLSSCTSPVATANSKLALFYDWLLYKTDVDNIMNIEPGILVMYHSMRPHPALTTSLLDFICRIIPNFHPMLVDKVRAGMKNSLKQILEKRVVQSLEPLFDNARMDLELRKLIRETFPEFCSATGPVESKPEEFPSSMSGSSVTRMDLMAETGLDFTGGGSMNSDMEMNNSNHCGGDSGAGGGGGIGGSGGDDDAMFSDEEEEQQQQQPLPTSNKGPPAPVPKVPPALKGPPAPPTQNNKVVVAPLIKPELPTVSKLEKLEKEKLEKEIKEELSAAIPTEVLEVKPILNITKVDVNNIDEKIDLNKHLDYLEPDMKTIILDYREEKDTKKRCNLVQKICDLILSEDLNTDEAEHLAACLCHLFSPDIGLGVSLLPLQVTPETIEESMGRPMCVLFDNLVTLPEEDHRRTPLLILLYEMRNISQKIGYHFLFFLKATTYRNSNEEQDTSTLLTYRDLSKATGNKDFVGFFLKDLKLCSEDDPRVLSWIIPDMYISFPKQTCGNADLVELLLERLDSTQLHDLVCMVLQGSLVMFDNSSFGNILEKSLSWETVEQMFLWQLAKAHEIPVDCCLSAMPKLKFTSYAANVDNTHGEALSNILMMLRRESPTEQLLRTLFLREFRLEDPTVVTILQYWVQRYEDKMAKIINDVVNNKAPPSPNKRKRAQSTKQSAVPLDQVLSHLNHLRTACGGKTFFELETMQDALQTAQSGCGDAQKKKYSDLFAIIEEEEEEPQPEPQRKTGGRGKSARGKAAKGRKKAETESEEGSSEEEEEPEPQRKAKSNRGRKPVKGRKKQESESEEGSSEEEDVGKRPRKRKKNNQVGSDSE